MEQQKIEKLMACGVDYPNGVDRFGGNEAMFEKFILRFRDDTHFEDLKRAVYEHNPEEAYHVAHTLKGVVGNLSFKTYYETLSPVSDLLKQGDIDTVQSKIHDLERVHSQTIEVLNEV